MTESSGLVASRRNPGRYWTHNDSDDEPVLYCVGSTGEACGAWRVTGGEARDWEDIAAGPGPDPAKSYLYVGDIGDNLRDLGAVVVYRVPDPDVPSRAGGSGPGRSATEPAGRLRLRYPDGPHDAEALLVHPDTGDVYVVVKEPRPNVYVARAPLKVDAVNTLEPVATIAIDESGDRRAGLVTGGDIAPDGRRVALCTYLAGYELELPEDASGFDDVWRQAPRRVAVGPRVQGEAIAYRLDGDALLTTSEGTGGLPVPLQQVERQ